ncbi:MAG: Uma2 family endonuclease [Cytophagales bacterium]
METLAKSKQKIYLRKAGMPDGTAVSLEQFLRWEPQTPSFKYEWNEGKVIKIHRKMDPKQNLIYSNLLEAFDVTTLGLKKARLITEVEVVMNQSFRRPDIALFTKEQLIKAGNNEVVMPEFMIEVISKSDNYPNTLEKTKQYFDNGARLVWHILPSLKLVKVFTSIKNDITCSENDLIPANPVINDLNITVNQLFKDYN